MDLWPANAAHWHLVLNHLPVVGSLAALLLLGWGFLRNSPESKRIGLTALFLVGVVTVPAFLTGEPSEPFLEDQPGISSRWMSEHEDAAEIALGTALAAGVLALGGLLWFRGARVPPRWFIALNLAAGLVVGYAMARTANYGGKIHHPEIRTPARPEPSAGADA